MKPPFSPEILDAMPEAMAELFRSLEITLLEGISKRLQASGKLNEAALSNIRALRSHGIYIRDIEHAIRDTSGKSSAEIIRLIDDAVLRNQQYYSSLISISDITAPEVMLDKPTIYAIRLQMENGIKNITRSMGFVVDSGRTMLPPAKAYQWALDSAVVQVESGGISYGQAIANATRQLADSGLQVVTYESGARSHVDVAVRRAVMTGINQLNRRFDEQSMELLKTDLVEVSAHSGARDKGIGFENHKLWQGKVYRWKKYTRMFPDASHKNYPDFEYECGYGDVQGILGANCRHKWTPFVEDVMERTYTDEQLEHIDNPPFEYEGRQYTTYEATQKQRQIENSIRHWKRREAAATTPEDKQAAASRIRILNRKYKEFSNAAGLRMQPERMKVYTSPNEPSFEVSVPEQQITIGTATTVEEVNKFMNSQGWFASHKRPVGSARWDESQMKYVHDQFEDIVSMADLTGCDLESAKSIASSYQQVFEKYPQLIGKFDAPNAQPVGMDKHTYAWCYIRGNGKVQVNPNKYNSWQSLVRSYESDVQTNWHPYGTTAESVVTHEIGHAIDGLLAREGVLGGITASGEYRYASSSLKTTIMKRAAKLDSDLAYLMEMDRAWRGSDAVSTYVSRYASKNPQEWFAECFAEYITSADPRVVASEFGKELERLVKKLS